MTAYFNENDRNAAAWLRALMDRGLIAQGVIDERSIRDVQPSDLNGFTQCHFFAGIGVWSHALRLAGWSDDRPVWTGSCPCQPFSTAGKGGGFDDPRHLWPEFYRLICEHRPHVVLGEQTSSKAGRSWIDLVSTDLENADYAFGAANIPAAGVGAPHIRQRYWWVADTNRDGCDQGRRSEPQARNDGPFGNGGTRGVGNSGSDRAGEYARELPGNESQHEVWPSLGDHASVVAGAVGGFWRDAEWIPCGDGKARPVEPGTFPLAHGAPARVGRLRGYGNAIVAQVAAEFIEAYLDVRGG